MADRLLETTLHMWPLTRKRSLGLAVLTRIAARLPFSSRVNGKGCRLSRASYPCNKIKGRAAVPCKKNCQPFEPCSRSVWRIYEPCNRCVWRNLLAVRAVQSFRVKKFTSRSTVPCKENCQPVERQKLSVQSFVSSSSGSSFPYKKVDSRSNGMS